MTLAPGLEVIERYTGLGPYFSVGCTIPEDQLGILHKLALARNACKSRASNKRVAVQGDETIHFIGIQAEYAVAQLLGCELDTSIDPAGDDKVTDLTHHGARIQVKARWQRPLGDLYFQRKELFRADFAVLANLPENGKVELVGFTDRGMYNTFAKNKFFKTDLWCLEQQHLSPIQALDAACRQANPAHHRTEYAQQRGKPRRRKTA